MKRLRSLAIMSALLLFATCEASAQKSDEAAIKKVLNQETSSYFHKNYDEWTKTWAHDSADYVLHAGPNGHSKLEGWNAISAQYKNDIQGLEVRTDKEIEPFLNKQDFRIYVNGNMAAVTFSEGDENPNVESRTMVKENGAWKILNFTMLNNKAYAMEQAMGNMRTFVGKWVLDGKPTMEPSNGGELNSGEFDLKETPLGFEQLSSFIYTTKSGQSFAPPAGYEYFVPDYNTNTITYTSIRKNRFGQTFTGTGKITSKGMNSFTVTTMYPDKPGAIQNEYTVTLKDGKWHQVDKDYDQNGKQTSTSTLEMHRVDE